MGSKAFLHRLQRYLSKRVKQRIFPVKHFIARYRVSDKDLIEIHHLPKCFARRYGDFTANICGLFKPAVKRARYRLNDGTWTDIKNTIPRVPSPLFNIELSDNELSSGLNELDIKVVTYRGKTAMETVQFQYDRSVVHLPRHIDWNHEDIDSQDGKWQKHIVGDACWIRPYPGEERYDRILVVSGAFAGARQVETEIIFQSPMTPGKPFGFGILPLWGGRPDSMRNMPREGWNFSLVWYYSHYDAVGIEFSYKDGKLPPAWIATYRNFDLEPGVPYRVKVQCWPKFDMTKKHLGYIQRMKWWERDETEPVEWMETSDIEGAPISPGEYGVTLIAHQVQALFGPVSITALDAESPSRW